MLLLQLRFFKKIKERLNAVIKSKPVSCTELSNWIPVDTELEKLLFTQMLETLAPPVACVQGCAVDFSHIGRKNGDVLETHVFTWPLHKHVH